MTLIDLVGFQLVSLNDENMVVQKDEKTYVISFECSDGYCCGSAEIKHTLYFEPNDFFSNPVITRIEHLKWGSEENDDDGQIAKITLFGKYRPLANLSASAGSGSGYCYGATVTAICKPLQLDQELVVW